MGRPLPSGIGDGLGVDLGSSTGSDGFRGPQREDGDELFDRTWRVVIATSPSDEVDGARVAGTGTAVETTVNDVKFKVVKSIKSEPNKCTLEIYNLNPEHRKAIEELNPTTKRGHVRDAKKIRAAARKTATKGIGVQIEAGYNGKNSLIWLGDMRSGESEFVSPNWVTKLTSGDGEKSWQNARVNVSYGPKTPTAIALRAMVKALGIGEGNLKEIIQDGRVAGKYFPQGTVISGPVSTLLTDYCRSADLQWWIHDGVLHFAGRGQALKDRAVLISKDTGMIGAPKLDIDSILTVKTEMIPDIRPGRLIVVEADQHGGNYRAEQIIYDGDSAGNDWGLTIKAVAY